MRDGRQYKKSKWDKVDGDRRNPLPSAGQDSMSSVGHMQHSYLQPMLVLDTVVLRKSYFLNILDFILAQLASVPSVCVFSLLFTRTTLKIRQTSPAGFEQYEWNASTQMI